jgi:hypothetical protein
MVLRYNVEFQFVDVKNVDFIWSRLTVSSLAIPGKDYVRDNQSDQPSFTYWLLLSIVKVVHIHFD